MSGIDGLIDWIGTQSDPRRTPSDELVMNTLKWSMRSVQFGRDSLAALNALDLPPIPEREEYGRLVAKLDEQADGTR